MPGSNWQKVPHEGEEIFASVLSPDPHRLYVVHASEAKKWLIPKETTAANLCEVTAPFLWENNGHLNVIKNDPRRFRSEEFPRPFRTPPSTRQSL